MAQARQGFRLKHGYKQAQPSSLLAPLILSGTPTCATDQPNYSGQ